MPEKANNSEDKVRHFQRELYRAAKRSPNRRFHVLYDKLIRRDVLVAAWKQVKANRGRGGMDGESLEKIEKEGVGIFLKQIQEELKAGTYRPKPVKRVEIPKPDGGKRPLGIPIIRDQVVQAACRKMVEPIFEADFLKGSYGFRPKRSAHQAHGEITLILEDVTKHILAERKIRESEERFRMMADNIQDGLIILENGNVKYANNRIAEITGYSHEELWAMDPLAIIAPESRDKTAEQIRDFETHPDKPSEIQMWIIRKDGERKFAYARISGIKHLGSYYNFIIFTDITELKTQEARMHEGEQRFRMMAENIQDGLIVLEKERVVFTNRRIKEITGYSAEEMAAMGLHGTTTPDDRARTSASGLIPPSEQYKIEELIRCVQPDGGGPGEFRIWIQLKDGTLRFIQGMVTAARNGDVTSTYITLSDITDFAEREKTLRERIDSLQELLH